MQNVQSAWLLLLYCGSARANYLCNVVDPHYAAEYAVGHDANLLTCLYRILEIQAVAINPIWKIVATLPLCQGGLGLQSMMRIGPAAYWASWADCLSMIQNRHPDIAEHMIDKSNQDESNCRFMSKASACRELKNEGWYYRLGKL